MHLSIILALITSGLCFYVPDTCVEDLSIEDRKYKVNGSLDVGEALPTETHYDTYGNLFYVLAVHRDDETLFDAYVLNYHDDRPNKIEGLPNGKCFSIAIDRTFGDVYFGTDEGIYRYDYESCTAELDSSKDLSSDNIFVDKDGNKFITEHVEGIELLYVLEGDNKVRYNAVDTLNEMTIDDKGNIFFIKEEKLFILKNDLLVPNYICDLEYEGNAQITVNDGTVYIASQRVIYFHENGINKLKSMKNAPDNVTTIAFDHNGEFVLGSPGKITKYRKQDCYLRN